MRFFTRSRLVLFLLLLLLCASGLGFSTSLRGVARAAGPGIWLSYKVGHPTAIVQVHGYSFGHRETVSLDFDTTQVGMVTTDGTGKFVVQVTVPKTALPGMHAVQATGQTSRLTAQTPFLVQTDWAQFRYGPYHTGNNPYENVLTTSNVSTLTRDWSYPTGSAITSSPAVANGIVYFGSVNGSLYALDAVTGTFKWSYPMKIISSPTLANGVIYCGGNKLYALDATTGALKWSQTIGGEVYSSPSVANGVVYIGSHDDSLYAFHLPGMSS